MRLRRAIRPMWKLLLAVPLAALLVAAVSSLFVQPESRTGKHRGKRASRPGSPAAIRAAQIESLRAEAREARHRADLPQGESRLRAILALEPYDAAARKGLGEVLERSGRTNEALDAYKLLVYDQPRWGSSLSWNAGFLSHFAELADQAGRTEEALCAFRRILTRGMNAIGEWAARVPSEASTVNQARASLDDDRQQPLLHESAGGRARVA